MVPTQKAPPIPASLKAAAGRRAGKSPEEREQVWRWIAGALGALAVVSLAGNLLMYARFTPARPLVTIGGKVIRKQAYEAELDEAAGKPVLTKLVFAELIRQAAAKAGVTPTPAQIDARLAEMGRRGGPKPTGPDAPKLRENVELALALENLRIQNVTATDAEVAAFYRKNAVALTQPAQVQSILVVTPNQTGAQAATALLAKGESAHDLAGEPNVRVDGENGFHLPLNALPVPLHRQIAGTALAMRTGQITTLPLGPDFLTIKCLHKEAASQPPLAQIRGDVARMVKLSKAPTADAELAGLYQANPPVFDIDRYAVYLDDVAHADLSGPPGVARAAGVH